jgi:hypothetical protein
LNTSKAYVIDVGWYQRANDGVIKASIQSKGKRTLAGTAFGFYGRFKSSRQTLQQTKAPKTYRRYLRIHMSILRKDFYDEFARIPNELISDHRLSNGAFRVLCLLFSKPNNWKVYNKAIMRELCIKKPHTMAEYWKECIESGWLSRELITDSKDGTVGAYNYSINLLPKMGTTAEEGTAENGQLPKMGIHNNTNSKNNTKESNNNPLPLCIDPTVWAEWVQHRKEIKKPLTPTTIKKQIAQLEKFDKLGMDTTEIINASISAGYVGLFALRHGKKYEAPKSKMDTTMETYEKAQQQKREMAQRQNSIDGEIVG